MLVPLAVAVPWLACVATATETAVPPLRLSVIGLLVELKATVALTAPATGAAGFTVEELIEELRGLSSEPARRR